MTESLKDPQPFTTTLDAAKTGHTAVARPIKGDKKTKDEPSTHKVTVLLKTMGKVISFNNTFTYLGRREGKDYHKKVHCTHLDRVYQLFQTKTQRNTVFLLFGTCGYHPNEKGNHSRLVCHECHIRHYIQETGLSRASRGHRGSRRRFPLISLPSLLLRR